MSGYSNRAAYLKGLVEGMNLDKTKDETKIFGVMVDLLQEMSIELESLKADCVENKELIYELDEDLGEVEKIVFECSGKGHKHSGGCVGSDGACECSHDDGLGSGDYDEQDECVECGNIDGGDDESSERYEVLCPHCRQVINLEEAHLKNNEIVCPKCGEELELDFGDDDSGDSLTK